MAEQFPQSVLDRGVTGGNPNRDWKVEFPQYDWKRYPTNPISSKYNAASFIDLLQLGAARTTAMADLNEDIWETWNYLQANGGFTHEQYSKNWRTCSSVILIKIAPLLQKWAEAVNWPKEEYNRLQKPLLLLLRRRFHSANRGPERPKNRVKSSLNAVDSPGTNELALAPENFMVLTNQDNSSLNVVDNPGTNELGLALEKFTIFTNQDEPGINVPFITSELFKGHFACASLDDFRELIATFHGKKFSKDEVSSVCIWSGKNDSQPKLRLTPIDNHMHFLLELAREKKWTEEGIQILYRITRLPTHLEKRRASSPLDQPPKRSSSGLDREDSIASTRTPISNVEKLQANSRTIKN